MMRCLASRTAHAVAFVLLYLLLLIEYVRFVYGHFFSIMGFDYQLSPVPFLSGVLLLGVLLGVLFYLPPVSDRMYFLALFVGILFCLPQIVMLQVGKAAPWGALYSLLFVLLLQAPLLRLGESRLPKVNEPSLKWFLPVISLLALVPFVATYGVNIDLSLFSFGSNTYDRRAEAASLGNVFTAYLMGPLYKVILPLMMLYGLLRFRKSWWLALLAIAMMVYLFLINPQKTILFSIAIVMVCALFRDCFSKSGIFVIGVLGLCLASVVLNLVAGNVMAESIVVRRLFFIPALVSDCYFTFFDHHPLFLSHSFLGSFFDYPYTLDPSHLIGKMMYNRTITSCNTGIIADGFMNFGHLGSLFFVAIGAMVMHLLESADYDGRYVGLVVLLLFSFLNGALFTSLLTHGGWLLILVVLFVLPRRKEAVC